MSASNHDSWFQKIVKAVVVAACLWVIGLAIITIYDKYQHNKDVRESIRIDKQYEEHPITPEQQEKLDKILDR